MLIINKEKFAEILKSALGSQKGDHDYIYRVPIAEKHSGKSVRRYKYLYAWEQIKKPFEKLAEFFGINEKQVDEMYAKENIQKDFNADKKTFAQHLVEYFSHRKQWDDRFAPKENQQKFNKPVKMATFKENADVLSKDMETPAPENDEPSLFSDKELKKLGAKNKGEWKANPYLMRRIWGMFTGKTVQQQEKQAQTAEKKVADEAAKKEEQKKLIAEFAEKHNLDPKKVEAGMKQAFKEIDNIGKKTEKKPTKAQLLKDVIKPQLFDLGIIPHSQIEATNTEQIDNVQALLETIATMPKMYEGDHTARLHYFVGGMDYYITELGDDGVGYGYVDNNGDTMTSEWGYVDLKELASAGDMNGLNIDYFFTPKLVGDLIKESGHRELAEEYEDTYGEEEAEMKEKAEDKKPAAPKKVDWFQAFAGSWNKFYPNGTGGKPYSNISKIDSKGRKITESWRANSKTDLSGILDNANDFVFDCEHLGEKSRQNFVERLAELGFHAQKEYTDEKGETKYMLMIRDGSKAGLVEMIPNSDYKKKEYTVITHDEAGNETDKQVFSDIDSAQAFMDKQRKALEAGESEAEKHENRSNAMLGNQNAKKFGMPEDVYEIMRNMVSEQVNGQGIKNRQILFEKLYKKDDYFRKKLDMYGGTSNEEITGYKRSDIFNALYDDVTGGEHGEDNSGIGRNGLSAGTSDLRSGTGEGNGDSNVSETESAIDGNEFVQQPRESGIGLGERSSDNGRNGAGSGRVTKATAKQIRAKCLELLATKKDSEMTAEDKALLSQYEGGGGLNEGGQSTKAVLTEFYTPRDVISKVWELVDKYNPNQKKKVLEPSSGIGRFAEGRNEDFTLCELDETSARIAGILHPDSEVKQGAFQKLFMQNNAVTGYKGELYDVAIGNPPYGAYNDLYKGMGEGKHHTRYEEYFIDRSLDTLKDGGILAFVVPSSFLRGKNGKGKEAIAKKGKLLEAWRLPKGTFSSTDVGTDIIVIQKGKGDIADYCDNKYFADNESHVIGHETEGKDRFGKPTKIVNLPEGKTVAEAISMIDTKAVEVKEIAKNVEVKTVQADLSKRFTVIGKLQVGAELTRPDGAKGKITYITDGGMIGYEFDSKTNPGGRTSLEDFAVLDDKETAEEISRKRSEAMKGNDNAKKAFHKQIVKKATKGDVFTPSIGKNMTAQEFNAKYSKDIPEADMKFWKVTDWEGKVDVTKLTDEEREELGKNKNFVTDENGNIVNVANYASGNIVEKLAKLEAEKDRISKESYEEKKAILEAVLPARKNIMQFTISPKENFALQFKDDDGISLKDKFLAYCGFNENGRIGWNSHCPIPKSELADGMTMQDIWDYVNQIPVRTERTRNPEDAETAKMFAEQKKNARRETTERLFNKWLRELPERQQNAIEDEWNARFNSRVNPDYKKIPLFVDGMNTHKGKKKFDMTEQQIKGVSMLCNKGNGILAYDVGVGKTVTGIVATVNQIQTGKAKRPIICVPKSVYKKWIKEIKQHFPNQTINELGNFSEKDLGRFKDSDGKVNLPEGALNVCTYEALQKVTFKEETLNGDLRDDMLDSQSVYDYDEYGNLVEDTRSEREKAQAEEKLMKMLGIAAEAKPGAVYWEDLGIDHITVDELHNFKNVFSIPRTFGKSVRSTNEKKTDYWGRKIKADDDPGQLSNEYSGMQGATSGRAMKLFAISQLIQRETNGRGFFGLSATPFNNSPVEIYNILSMVARNRLKDLEIYNLQDFMKQFAEMKPDWKVQANGDVVSAQVMKNFKNLNALQNLITEFIDKVDGEEAGVVRPYKRVHKPELDLTPLQKAIIKAETDRMDGKFSKPGDDNKNSADALIAMNNMRMATLSPALIDPKFWADYEDYEGWHKPQMKDIVKESPKLQFVCDTASTQYKERPTEGQVIYMPRGTNQYQYVKDYLVSKGVPADAIAFMDSSTSLADKERIKDDFNDVDGKIKIIIGSETIKEGVSLNGNSTTLYNTMLGWNPTETIQVEGRIWRQNNKQGITHIVYPLMNDSIDAMMYQKYDEKSSRLNALWSYKGDSLNVEDINPEELKFELIKDPKKRASMKILQEQADLKKQQKMTDALYDTIAEQMSQRKNLIGNTEYQTKQIPEYEKSVANYTNLVEETEKKLKAAKKAKEDTWRIERDLENYKYSVNSYKSQLRLANKAIKENGELIAAIENSWRKQGVDNPENIEEKLSEISARRHEISNKLGEIEGKFDFYVAEAKKQIEDAQRKQKHYSVADRVDYYAKEIGNDLKPFEEIKDQIKADMEKKRNGGIAKAIIYNGRLLIQRA
ncbi:SNF2-related protein [uncultured Treponema sp.]|uniref:Eco57I restriction-modification methylase domain-containing protein n=1 Tax=uncultured Treponema sp. TaxID=162155 RepID=UPI0025CE1376|nr:SNF2-related protein [uncultured Treponema sp.]